MTAPAICGADESESTQAWEPPPPMPDDYDWVQLTSGEWLKGEFVGMYWESLEFDSKKLNLLIIDWEDVREVRSGGTMQIGFGRRLMIAGRIHIDQETIRILGQETQEFPRSQIVSIAPGEPREINYWNFKASLGANLREGNTEQIETTADVNLSRRTSMSRINLSYLATFNVTDGLKAADNQRASTVWSYYASHRVFFTPLYGEWFRDPFQNVSDRWSVGTGVGYEIMDTPRIEWEVVVGPGYQSTLFEDVAEGDPTSADTPSFVVATTFENELSKRLDFLFDYRAFFVNQASGTYTHHLITGFELDITSVLDFDITLIWDRIRDPQPDSEGNIPEQDDFRLVVALGLDL